MHHTVGVISDIVSPPSKSVIFAVIPLLVYSSVQQQVYNERQNSNNELSTGHSSK